MLLVQFKFQVFCACQRSERELCLVYFKQTAHLKVVLRVELLLHCDIVVQNFQKLDLQHVNVVCVKKRVNKCEVLVAEVIIIPNLLRYQQGAQD